MKTIAKMPAGTYYLGDLCYVMGDRWDDVCEKTIDGHNVLTGRFVLDDGVEFAILNTKYGDGFYSSNIIGNDFPVDSGSIGVVKLEYIEKTQKEIDDEGLGRIVVFGEEFGIADNEGTLCFGDIRIYTNDDSEEEDCVNDDDGLFVYYDEMDDDFDYHYDEEKDH